MTRAAALLLLLPLTGCTADGRPSPSLAPRAAERGSFDEPVRPVAAATPDVALDASLARQADELRRLSGGFATAAAVAEKEVAVAGHAPVGSEAWLAAQSALARLDDWRSQTTALTAAIEGEGSARAARLEPPYPALDALVVQAAAESDRQSATVQRLQARVPAA